MRVYVSSSSAELSPQIRTYAEYRIFAALARFPEVLEAHVLLQSDDADGVECSVVVEDAAGSTRTTRKGPQAAGTIDRTAERVAELMRRRFQPETAAASS